MTKVVHIVYQSYPNISGSSTRTRSILLAQKAAGIDVAVISAPGQAPAAPENARSAEEHESIVYHRSYLIKGAEVAKKKNLLNRIKKVLAFPYFVWRVFFISRQERPDVLHAHAMFYCAIAALIAGRLLSIPVVYEIRSIWYKNSNADLQSRTQHLVAKFENFVVRRVSGLVVISDGIARAFSSLRQDIVIVRNAVSMNDIILPDLTTGNFPKTFGFIGSVISLEGLDMVIETFARLKCEGHEVTFHVVGEGKALAELKRLAVTLKAPVIFYGSVPFEQVGDLYESFDCIINYRRDEPVAQDVTPLKPIEAAAHGKLVICSNVGGMIEIMGGRKNAIFVPSNDTEALYSTLIGVLHGDYDISAIRKRATVFLKEHRTWEANIKIYKDLYESLI